MIDTVRAWVLALFIIGPSGVAAGMAIYGKAGWFVAVSLFLTGFGLGYILFPFLTRFQSFDQSKLRRQRAIVCALFLAPVALIGAACLVLLNVSSQSHKYVYVFQTVWFGGHKEPQPPANYTGVWCRWLVNGQQASEEHYVSGQLDGSFIEWDSNGNKRLETTYRAGLQHGDRITFQTDGSVSKQCAYSEGKPTGRWVGFYQGGQKWFEFSHSSPGKRDGEEIRWKRSGEVSLRRIWREGTPWTGRFSNYEGKDEVVSVYEVGRLVSQTNLGPWRPIRSGRLRGK